MGVYQNHMGSHLALSLQQQPNPRKCWWDVYFGWRHRSCWLWVSLFSRDFHVTWWTALGLWSEVLSVIVGIHTKETRRGGVSTWQCGLQASLVGILVLWVTSCVTFRTLPNLSVHWFLCLSDGKWWQSESEVAQSCLSLCDPMDCSLPGSSIHGILQARVLEWVAISFSRGSSQPRDRTWVSCIADRCFTVWATREAWLP